MGAAERFVRLCDGLERWLEAERDQLILWLPVMLGTGIAAWFVLPDAAKWTAFLLGAGAVALVGLALSGAGRAGRVMLIVGLTMSVGCGLVWWRAEQVAAPVLARTGDRPGRGAGRRWSSRCRRVRWCG